MNERVAEQRIEFDAVAELAAQYRRITLTPVIDDDYFEVRHGYETAVKRVIDAFAGNRREPFRLLVIAERHLSLLCDEVLTQEQKSKQSGLDQLLVELQKAIGTCDAVHGTKLPARAE